MSMNDGVTTFSWQERLLGDSRLFVAELPHSPSVSVAAMVRVGTRNEEWPRQAGLAHALEHMVFHGTELFPNQTALCSQLENTGGDLNAWANDDTTLYQARTVGIEVETAVVSVAERVLHPLLPEEMIEREMNNIIQEIRRAHDTPSSRVRRRAKGLLFGPIHPLGRDVLGTEEAVSNFTRQDFWEFHQEHYRPSNCDYFIAGPVTVSKAHELFERYFGTSFGRKSQVYQEPIYRKFPSCFIEQRDIKQAHLVLSAPTVGARKEEAETKCLTFFSSMLRRGMASPLFQRVRTELGLCYEISCSSGIWPDAGRLSIYVGLSPDKIDPAIEAIHQVIQTTKNDPDRFAVTKKMALGSLAIARETSMEVINLGVSSLETFERVYNYQDLRKEIEKMTIEDIEKVVDCYLAPENWRQVVVGPAS